jgi:hypothetical protein
MRANPPLPVDTTVLGAASLLAIALGGDPVTGPGAAGRFPARPATGPPVGRWRSADGTVCLHLRTDGTYAGRVAGRRQPAQGTYDLHGAALTLRDDSGLRTPVTLHGDTLEMAGHRLGPA